MNKKLKQDLLLMVMGRLSDVEDKNNPLLEVIGAILELGYVTGLQDGKKETGEIE